MTRAISDLLWEEKPILYRMSVDDYHAMIENGTLPEGEPYELLDGLLVRKDRSATGEDPMTVSTPHTYAVIQLERLNRVLESRGCHMRAQHPVTLPLLNEPEPDGLIAKGTFEDYAHDHPGAKDILAVIEVSDSSLRRDRTTKLQIYAGAGIEKYFIINLLKRQIETYRNVSRRELAYADSQILTLDDSIEFPVAQGEPLAVPVKQFFTDK